MTASRLFELVAFSRNFLKKKQKQKQKQKTKAATGGVLLEKMFLEISQNLQESACARVSFLIKLHVSGLQLYLKRNPGTGVLLWIWQNF